jgi:hypothetical protein
MKNLCVIRVAACAALVVLFSVGIAATGFAYEDGVLGASGKENGYYCRNCHAGGTVPTVVFEGPTTITPGSTATFRFAISSHSEAQIAAGLDVAVSGGILGLVEGEDTHLQFNEVTHDVPAANDTNAQATFEFTWKAPASEGTYTLFGAGCSVNGNDQRTGDAAARTTYEIVVSSTLPTSTPTPPLPTPTATATEGGSSCVGDCNNDGSVTVDEIITGVNVALGVAPASACPQFDADGDGTVKVDEIVQAVNNAERLPGVMPGARVRLSA